MERLELISNFKIVLFFFVFIRNLKYPKSGFLFIFPTNILPMKKDKKIDPTLNFRTEFCYLFSENSQIKILKLLKGCDTTTSFSHISFDTAKRDSSK